MRSTKNILFITWDGPQTNYAEGLFMPIFHEVEKAYPQYKFYYLQFTWAKDFHAQQKASKAYDIPYASAPIIRKPFASVGSLISLYRGNKYIKQCIKNWDINVLMPRSTFPAFMVNRGKYKLPVVFDADGLPIEERVDFAGLQQGGRMYNFLKAIEEKAIKNAQHILTRSQKSIMFHQEQYHIADSSKFSVVFNGRNVNHFKPNEKSNIEIRKRLNIKSDTTIFIYAGSFGPQYGWDIMLRIFRAYLEENDNAHFLFLTGSPEKVFPLISADMKSKFTVKKVPFSEVAHYLCAADIALAIREPKISMQGVAPIKLGEYLLTGIPTIASDGIGDTKEILEDIPGTFLYQHDNPPQLQEVVDFIKTAQNLSKLLIREKAIPYFSLEAAASSYGKALQKQSI